MRRIFAFLCLITLLWSLSACGGVPAPGADSSVQPPQSQEPPQSPQPGDGAGDSTSAPAPASSAQPPQLPQPGDAGDAAPATGANSSSQPPQGEGAATAEPDYPYPLPRLELRLSAEPERFVPTAAVTPLTNSRSIYSQCVVGDPTFIRADQSRVDLPSGLLTNYAAVKAAEDGAPLAYALFRSDGYNSETNMAFMGVDGRMLTDFVYMGFGEDSYHFPNRYGYVTVARRTSDASTGYGLLELAGGREVIAPVYDWVEPLRYAVLVEQDGRKQLLDYGGELLFDLGEGANIVYDTYIPSGTEPYSFFFGSGYTYDSNSGEVYSHALPEHIYALRYGGLTMFSDNRDPENLEATVYGPEGERLYRGAVDSFFATGGGLVLTNRDSKAELIYPDRRLSLTIPAMDAALRSIPDYTVTLAEGRRVVFTYTDEKDHSLNHTLTYDFQGREMDHTSEYKLSYEYKPAGEPGAGLRTRYRSSPDEGVFGQQLEDMQGNILVPSGRYGSITVSWPFCIGWVGAFDNVEFDIMDRQGRLLLEHPWGAITYENGLSDRMVVWTDADTCIFLYPDGSTEPIDNPPEVERMYFGG